MLDYILHIEFITCFLSSWLHFTWLSICHGQGSLRCSYSAFSCAWYLDSKRLDGEKLLYRNTSSQHSCCMFCVFHCKYCMLHTCISLKMMSIGSYTHKNLASFLPIVGTDGGMLDMLSFLFFFKMNYVIFFKKQGKNWLFKPKVATNQLLNCHWH